jgi:hypothetical protein
MTLSSLLSYVFYPNPGNAGYSSPSQLALLTLSLALVAASVGMYVWRKRSANPVTKKLTKTWTPAALCFGLIGAVLVISRVEGIQFLAMRFMWVLWFGAVVAFAFLQYKLFRARHYHVLPSVRVSDPRDRYLPGKKKRR